MDSEDVNIFNLVVVNFGDISIDARPYAFDELSTKVVSYHTTCPKCIQRVDIPTSKIKISDNIKYVFCETCNLGLDKWNSLNTGSTGSAGSADNVNKAIVETTDIDDIILLDNVDFNIIFNDLTDTEIKYTKMINE